MTGVGVNGGALVCGRMAPSPGASTGPPSNAVTGLPASHPGQLGAGISLAHVGHEGENGKAQAELLDRLKSEKPLQPLSRHSPPVNASAAKRLWIIPVSFV